MKNSSILIIILLTIFTWSCTLDIKEVDPVITEPPFSILISSDTLTSGRFLGLEVAAPAQAVYQQIQRLPASENVNYLNIVGNFATHFTDLKNRLPLYSYFWLDEAVGTDSGVQVNLENGKVTHIYLGSGKSLAQWPNKGKQDASLRIGDSAENLYAKLAKIKTNTDYAKKFEKILLLTKNLSTAYDPAMTQSPQWYFAHQVANNQLEEVQLYFKSGLVAYIVVNRYQS